MFNLEGPMFVTFMESEEVQVADLQNVTTLKTSSFMGKEGFGIRVAVVAEDGKRYTINMNKEETRKFLTEATSALKDAENGKLTGIGG
jgi:hypothetical protein